MAHVNVCSIEENLTGKTFENSNGVKIEKLNSLPMNKERQMKVALL